MKHVTSSPARAYRNAGKANGPLSPPPAAGSKSVGITPALGGAKAGKGTLHPGGFFPAGVVPPKTGDGRSGSHGSIAY